MLAASMIFATLAFGIGLAALAVALVDLFLLTNGSGKRAAPEKDEADQESERLELERSRAIEEGMQNLLQFGDDLMRRSGGGEQ